MDKGTEEATNQNKLGPQTTARKWKAEIQRGLKQQKKWVDESDDIMKLYRSDSDGAKAPPMFNILASNTETIMPAVYNSTPLPDIRRRYRKDDKVGKVISEILQNCISYENDTLDFDETMQMVILDSLLPGRGVTIVEYEPVIQQQLDEMGMPMPLLEEQVEGEEYGDDYEPAQQQNEYGEPLFQEEIQTESSPTRHIQYCDFIHGTGQEWHEIDWIGIRYRMTKAECRKMFPDTYENIQSYSNLDEGLETNDKDMNKKMRTTEIWKVWNKTDKNVIFISESSMVPLKIEDDPLRLEGFFPCPMPLMFKKDQTSLMPMPPYRFYKAQAEELNKVIAKRNAIISALKARGIYDASLGEDVTKLMNSGNMELIPIRNKQQIEAAGGIGNAIWMMPIADLANVLNNLYEAEGRIKNTIYEITGIADIMRGATSPGAQTATEQRIKSQWGSLRIQDLQRDIQRMAKEVFRIKAEIMAEHYQPQTLLQMSGVDLPPELGEAVLMTLKDDKLRGYTIDIETDSTIQETIERDMAGMSEVMGGISQLFESMGPVVQAGAMAPEALQGLILGFVRKARLGREVEDYFAQDMVQQEPKAEELEKAEQLNADAQLTLQAVQRINQENQVKAEDIAAGMAQYEKMVQTANDYAASVTALNQIAADIAQTKGVDSQAIRALREVQKSAAVTTNALTVQMEELKKTVDTPKVVQFNRDDKGKINGAVAVPAPPTNNGV